MWWHCDVIHSVAPVEESAGLGQRDVHPRRTDVRENLAYAKKVKEALETGASPGDFPREDYEKTWQDRFTVNDLNIHGKRALGMV
ncbi:FIG01046262: hypothetical protein [Enterobacter hormaechei]|nr:FIG01046262: hypothetical protein [Enterobacter hormaechei]